MKYRLICSLLVVMVCAFGYLGFNAASKSDSTGSDDSVNTTSATAPPVAPPSSSDDNSLKDLKVN